MDMGRLQQTLKEYDKHAVFGIFCVCLQMRKCLPENGRQGDICPYFVTQGPAVLSLLMDKRGTHGASRRAKDWVFHIEKKLENLCVLYILLMLLLLPTG